MLIGGSEARDGVAAPSAALDDPRRVFHALPGNSREEVLEALASCLAEAGFVREPGELVRRLVERESQGCTGFGGGIAFPHCRLHDLDEVVAALATTANPIDFGAADGVPVDIIALVASPAEAMGSHLQVLGKMVRLLKDPGVVSAVRAARSREELFGVLHRAQAGTAVSP